MENQTQPGQPSVEQMLAEYRHRKTREAMIGPAVSLALHVLFFFGAFLMYSPQKPVEIAATVEINSTEEQPPEEIEDLEELELPPPEEQVREVQDTQVAEVAEVASDVNTAEIAESALSDNVALSEEAPTTDFTNVLNVQSNKTDFKISGLYAGRTAGGRRAAISKYGGKISGASETSVNKALEWLKKTQNPNGSWAPDSQHAMTGLCLLTFLAHGEDTNSKKYGETIAKAIQFLADETMKRDVFSTNITTDVYTNGIVAYALSEAYGMTKLPLIKEPMEKCLRRAVKGQQRSGGYDYGYKKELRWDLSVSAWQYQALKAGYVAGADVKGLERAIEKGVDFLQKVCYKRPRNATDRPFGYEKPGEGSDGMQGAGTLCLQLLGEGNSAAAKNGVKFIYDIILNPKTLTKTHVHWDNVHFTIAGPYSNPLYYWYYCTQAMFHAGGSQWKDWHERFTPLAMKAQNPEGYWDSPGKLAPPSKDLPNGGSKGAYDRWYTTALTALSLQVYYRYLPSYKLEKGKKEAEASELDKIDEDLGF